MIGSEHPAARSLAARAERGSELGYALCVLAGDDVLIDVWGGIADATTGTPWGPETVCPLFSVTKLLTAAATLSTLTSCDVSVDTPLRSILDPGDVPEDLPTTVAHVLSHSSGWAAFGGRDGRSPRLSVTDPGDFADPDVLAATLLRQQPEWTPGDGTGYHALTYGHLAHAIIRALTGESLGEALRRCGGGNASDPHRLAFISAPPGVGVTGPRWALLAAPSGGFPSAGAGAAARTLAARALARPPLTPELVASPWWRRIELGAANGHGTARGVAGVVHRHLPDAALVPRTSGQRDRVLHHRVTFGLGAAAPGPLTRRVLPEGRIGWWVGFGGSTVVRDADRDLTIAVLVNRLGASLLPEERIGRVLRQVYEDVDGATAPR